MVTRILKNWKKFFFLYKSIFNAQGGQYMENQLTKSKILSSLFWKLMERGGTQGIQFIVQIVLARLLSPKDFGTIAIVMVFVSVAQVFVQSGFNTALIQKKEVDRDDFSSVFYLSLFVALILYVILYISSPFLAYYYRDPILEPVLRVIGITFFFGAFNSIQNALVARNMSFKKLFLSSIGAILISGFLGISTAYMGFGVWALVIQQLSNAILITVIMWFTVKWRPKLSFSFKKVRILFSFGWKLLVSSLLNVTYMEIRTLLIGRIYTPSVLGYYNRGQQFPKVIVTNIDGSIQSVMLPTLSAYQDNKKRIKEMMRRAIVTSSFLIFPIMFGMMAIAEPLVKIILTDKWIPAVPFMQIFCISFALMPIHTANLQAINAMGRSDIFLKLEITKKIIGIIILAATIPFGVYSIALGEVLIGIISTFINAYPNKNILDYSYKEQMIDIMPPFLMALIMAITIYFLNYATLPTWQALTLQCLTGIIIYFGLAKISKNENLEYLLITVKKMIKSKDEMIG